MPENRQPRPVESSRIRVFKPQLVLLALCALNLSFLCGQERKAPSLDLDSLHVLDAIADSLIAADSLAIEPSSARIDSIYPFIRYAENQLRFYGKDYERSGYAEFFKAMDEVRQGKNRKIKILHIGGSHVQADVWSGETRRLLREWSRVEGERGFVFPQKLARSNGSPNFLVSYAGRWSHCKNISPTTREPIGLAGVTASTSDTLARLVITLVGENHAEFPYPQYRFTRAKIFHQADSASFEVSLDTSVAHQKLTSAEWGYAEFSFQEPQTRLPLRIRKTAPHQVRFALHGISLENEAPGFNYSAVGVNGATVGAFLRCSLLERHLRLFQPDLVIFSLGVNDSRYVPFIAQTYEKNYDALIAIIKAAAPNAAILFTTNSDNFRRRWRVNANTPIARDVLIRLAKRHNAAVWDLFNVMGGLGSFKLWRDANLARRDRVHFNRQGYRLIGKLMFEAIIDSYETRFGARSAKRSRF
ncbi:MAG: GDSL-type esterase/lipase family protein [Chloroherpetonaceae bacterium]|nr:GDSL-type esterase/lipase family protein [Chloroherpetonaceae bacterium]MDW8438582.1 GDSL-type esterase/lipase family protein [Chloroherpetonaceae bacterium]